MAVSNASLLEEPWKNLSPHPGRAFCVEVLAGHTVIPSVCLCGKTYSKLKLISTEGLRTPSSWWSVMGVFRIQRAANAVSKEHYE